MGGLESAGEGVHSADVGVEEVLDLETLATALRVEIETTGAESAHAQDAEHDLGGEVDVGGELIRVPADQLVAGVRVDRTEGIGGHGDLKLVHHRVAREGRVVRLDVQLQLAHESVLAEEVEASGRVGIILVSGGFARFRLDVEVALEADLLLVLHRHVEERGEVVQLALHVGVVKGRITLAAAPENVTFAAETVGHLERLLHLSRRVGEDVGEGRGARALVVTLVGEKTGRAPEQLDAGLFLGFFQLIGDRVEGVVRGLEVVQFRRDVAVVEAVVADPALLHELEHRPDAALRVFDRIGSVVPGTLGGGTSKGVGETVAHRMPVGRGEAEMLTHRLAADDFIRVVMLESERVAGLRPLERDDGDSREEFLAHDGSEVSQSWGRVQVESEGGDSGKKDHFRRS